MKSFFVRGVLEFAVITTAVIAATQFVKSGHPAVGLGILAVYAMFSLYRLGIEKINSQYERSLKEAQMRQLEDDLSIKEAQVCRLEAALVDAAVEALWVSDVETRGDKVVYKIDAPGHGRIVIYLPADDATKTDDAPAASDKG